MSFTQAVISKFENSYVGEPNSGCWLWEGSWPDGYGRLYVSGRGDMRAHRLSWEIHHGPIPEGLCVLHKCDVPPCVNPRHLFVGTHPENVADMVSKRRHRFGSRQHHAVLTEALAVDILKDPRPSKQVARAFGVSKVSVVRIKRGQSWTHATLGETDLRENPRGEQKPGSKLTENDVRAIRADGRIARLIAADYGVCISRIYAIKSRVEWRHVL